MGRGNPASIAGQPPTQSRAEGELAPYGAAHLMRIRNLTPEILDTTEIAPEILAAVLRDLATVNTLTRARAPTLQFMRRMARAHPGPLRVLDVGFGDGDMLRRIARWGARTGTPLILQGIDLNPGAAPAAQARSEGYAITYRTGDVFAEPPGEHDLILSSLFTHHLTDPQIVRFLRWMDGTACLGWFINDLHRHILARDGFSLLAAATGMHPIVRADGRLSVERSFRRADWVRLLREAGVDARITWYLPFRYCVASCTR